MTDEPHRELDGVEVVVVGATIAARMVAKLLADQGASVRRLALAGTSPGGRADHETDEPLEVVDVANDGSRAVLDRALAEADVLVDATSSSALVGGGAWTDDLRGHRPDLVVLALPAFPSLPDAPRIPDGEGEWAVAAALGLDQMGPRAPFVEPLAVASAYAAILGAVYVVTALLRCDQGVAGADMEVSLFGAGIMALDRRLVTVADPRCADPLGQWRLPIAERYECADGRFLQLQGATPPVARAVLNAFGHPEWTNEALGGITALPNAKEEQRWRDRFADVLRTRTALEWETEIARHAGAGVVCRTRQEWVAERHAVDAEIVVPSVADEQRPRTGLAVRVLDGAAFGAPGGTAARGRSPAAPDPASRLALDGVKVVDLSIILAGPTCGRLLAELGADVVKVDGPGRTGTPYTSPYGWLDVNRTKRSILVDLQRSDGRDLLWRLIEDADVLVENFRTEKLAALGFTPAAIFKRNPGIVYTSLNAYDFGGTFTARPGWEQNAQAVSGMQMARGRDGRPVQVTVPVNDYGTGLLGTYGTLLGIRAARRTGRGQRVLGSLARTATFLQMGEISLGQDGSLDERPFHLPGEVTFLRCQDGWVAAFRPDGADDQGAAVASPDADWSGETRVESIGRLADSGIVAVESPTVDEMATLVWVREAGYVATWKHALWGDMTNVFAHGSSTSFEQRPGWPSPDPGQDGATVLAAAGFTQEEIGLLQASGTVAPTARLFAL